MKAFLRSLSAHTPLINPTYAHALKNARLTHSRRALLVSLFLCALITSISAQSLTPEDAPGLKTPADASSSHRPERKRLVTLRRNETSEGARFTLTSDTQLGDYRSFAEGERVCIMIPQAAFVSQRAGESGRGFAEMRIEQREENVMLSFRLQQGATVAVNQNFNRLDVIFMTNERANSAREN
jgi:hypothetical protein